MFKKLKVLTEEDINKIIDEKLLNFKAEMLKKEKKKEPEEPLFVKDAKMTANILYEKVRKIDKEIDILLDTLNRLYDKEFDLKIGNVKYRFKIVIDDLWGTIFFMMELDGKRYSANELIHEKGVDFIVKLIDILEKRIIKNTQKNRNLTREIDLKMDLDKENEAV